MDVCRFRPLNGFRYISGALNVDHDDTQFNRRNQHFGDSAMCKLVLEIMLQERRLNRVSPSLLPRCRAYNSPFRLACHLFCRPTGNFR